jgi:hypothetical protein
VFLDELDLRSFAGQALHQGTQVIKVPCEAVHAVHDHGVPIAREAQEFRQLWSGCIPAGGLVSEDSIQDQTVELALLVLFQGTHAHVPNPLSSHRSLQPSYLWD